MAMALSVAQRVPVSTEQELVAAVRSGNDRAFEELYSRYRSRISAYIFGMVRDHARAEDLAQEVFISALRRLRDTERPMAFKPWIYEIARNACIDEFRRTRRTKEVPLAGDHDSDAEPGRELPSAAPTPDAAAESKQSLADLQGAFHGLSESHHKLIVMREFEGLSYDQIGERLGMTRPIVESTLFRARRRLSQEYDELASGRRCVQVQQVIDTTEERALRKLGIRQRRQLARHLSHCQPCRRHARMAGLDEGFFQTPTVIGKIAALLPFPWLRWRRGSGRSDSSVSVSATHSFLALRSIQTVARFAAPATASASAGMPRGAAAAVAAIALAGVGGGVVSAVIGHGAAHRISSSAPVATHVRTAPSQSASQSGLATVTSPVTSAARGAPGSRPHRAPARHSGSAKPAGSPGGPGPAKQPASHTGKPAAGAGSPLTKVLSGVGSAASGAATKITGVHVPAARTPKLPNVPGAASSTVPKLSKALPNPTKVISGVLKTGSSAVSSAQPKLPALPSVPAVPKPPDPAKLLP